MKKPEFTYMLEPGNNDGYIFLFEGKQEKEQGLLFFYEEKSLMKALKKNRKIAIISYEDKLSLLKEGDRLSKNCISDFSIHKVYGSFYR